MRSRPPIKAIKQPPKKSVHFPLSHSEEDREIRTALDKDPTIYAPMVYEVDYDNKKIYLSNPYQYREYPIIFAYVDAGKAQLEPRLLYYSKSHAIWRVAPTVTNKFGKGFETFSCDLPPLLNMSLMEQFNPMLEKKHFATMPIPIRDFVWAFTYPIEGYKEYSDEYEQQTKFGPDSNELIDIDQSETTGYGYIKNEALPLDLNKCFRDKNNLPDLSTVESITLNNAFYGQHLLAGPMKIHTCLSFDGKYRYLFAEDIIKHNNQNIRFLLTISKEPSSMNNFCVAEQVVKLGYQSATPISRPGDWISYLPDEMVRLVSHRGKSSGETYWDVSEYVMKLPINFVLQNPTIINALRSGKEVILDQSFINVLASSSTVPIVTQTSITNALPDTVTPSVISSFDHNRAVLLSIMDAIKNHDFELDKGGTSIKIDGKDKLVSKSAAKIFDKIVALTKDPTSPILDEKYRKLKAFIIEELKDKDQATSSFFGKRSESTAAFYRHVLNIISVGQLPAISPSPSGKKG